MGASVKHNRFPRGKVGGNDCAVGNGTFDEIRSGKKRGQLPLHQAADLTRTVKWYRAARKPEITPFRLKSDFGGERRPRHEPWPNRSTSNI